MNNSTKLWGGRFRSELSTETEDFTQSIDVDSRLVPHDIWASQVHAIMLARQSIISDDDLRQILPWLARRNQISVKESWSSSLKRKMST